MSTWRWLRHGAALACLLALGCTGSQEEKKDRNVEAVLRVPAGDNRQAIRKFVKEEGLEGLKRLLKSDSTRAHIAAITGLGELKDSDEATKLLLERANGKDTEEAYWALIALAHKGAPQARELIRKFFQSEEPRLREAACIAIKEYGDEALYPLLNTAAHDTDRVVQRVAARMSRIIKDGQAVKPPTGK